MKTVRQYYRVDRRQINLVRFTFEAYEGVAVVTTLDAASGLIVICSAPACKDIVTDVMEDLSRDIRMERVEATPAGRSILGKWIYDTQDTLY
jgi:hypothetical protein